MRKSLKQHFIDGLDVGLKDGNHFDLKQGLQYLTKRELLKHLVDPAFIMDDVMFRSKDRRAKRIHKIAKKIWRKEQENRPRDEYATEYNILQTFFKGYAEGFKAACEARFRKMMGL